MATNGKDGMERTPTLAGWMNAIERELEETAADLGIEPGAGWRKRLRRERAKMPDCSELCEGIKYASWLGPLEPRKRAW